jgi:hypothetical protein
MLAFYEIFGCFAEAGKIGTGGSGGPKTAPIGHVLADAALALRTITLTGSIEKAAEVIRKNKETFFDPEMAALEANTVARKVEGLKQGPVSGALLLGTIDRTQKAIESRVQTCYETLRGGGSLEGVIQELERSRIRRVETRASEIMSRNFGKKVEIKISGIRGGGRRSGKLGKKVWVLDPEVDVVVSIDGKRIEMKSFCCEFVPQAVLAKEADQLEAIAMAAPVVGELLISGHTLIDLLVPAAVAALLGVLTPAGAAKEAARLGWILSGGLPGCEEKTSQVVQLALRFYNGTPSLGGQLRDKP